MRRLGLNEIREEYLEFFESKGHLRLKSYPLIPNNDKSLLLINAGMAPLKDYFTGVKKMSKNRATSSQKCIRTADIDNVGKTQRHGTFFEMLGNFSFGDYFKREAITWAWEFLTEKLEMDKNLLSVTVYEEDDEAYNIWRNEIGLPAEKIQRLGKKDNFWELEVGPCGPCSEIMYDRGEKYTNPDDRFMEIWNLVFTQFNKDKDGNYHRLDHPNIDTGMGLERLTLVLEEKDNIFEIGLVDTIIKKIEEISGVKYKSNETSDVSIRVIADHARAMTFLIYDGVIPSNEQRGYVLRTHARVLQRRGPVKVVAAPLQDQARVLGVVDVLVDVEGDPAQGVDHGGQPGEVHDDGLVDVDVGQGLHGLDRAGHARGDGLLVAAGARPVGEGGVELALRLLDGGAVGGGAAGDVDNGVAGDGYDVDPGAVGGDVHDHGGVGAGDDHVVVALGAVDVVGAGARVRAQDQDVDGVPVVAVRDGVSRGAVRSEEAAGIDRGDLALEVVVGEREEGGCEDHQGQPDGQEAPHHAALELPGGVPHSRPW